jgi:hypothetical protein
LERCLGFETVALYDIIDVDLGLCVDSIFSNEMQIKVGHEHSVGGHFVGRVGTARPAGS